MPSRQELSKKIKESLEQTGRFKYVKFKGILDIEGDFMTVEYVTDKKAREILKQKIEGMIEQNYSHGIRAEFNKPDEQGRYKDTFTRCPREAMPFDTSKKFLKDYLGILDKYLFEV